MNSSTASAVVKPNIRAQIQKTLDILSSLTQQPKGCIYLQGEKERVYPFVDIDLPYQQHKHVLYLTGIHRSDCHFIIDVPSGKLTTFVPFRNVDYQVWVGKVPSLEEFQKSSGSDQVLYDSHFEEFMKQNYNNESVTIFTSTYDITGKLSTLLDNRVLSPGSIDTVLMPQAMKIARRTKTPEEIQIMKHINDISSRAHQHIWKTTKPGMSEYDIEAEFRYFCHRNGGTHFQAYNPIVAINQNAAILHYSGSPSAICSNDSFILVDAGGQSLDGYASDITRCYPVSGKFSETQKAVYNAVLKSQQAALDIIKAGVNYKDVQMAVVKSLAQSLLDMGLVKGSVDEIVKSGTVALFYPHGVGHLIGLDTHDPNDREAIKPIDPFYVYFRYLRYRKPIEEHMALTVEPGLYFIPPLLIPAYENPKFKDILVKSEIEKYMSVGGVRIEDNIIVTETGYTNLTTCPKTVEDIEAIMSQ